jgi:hypothetical protein
MGGKVVDAASFALLGTFPNVAGAPFVPDASVGRAYYVTQDPAPNTWVLRAFDISTFTQIGSLTIPNVTARPGRSSAGARTDSPFEPTTGR